MWDISFLCVNLSPVVFITHLIGALLLVMVHLLEHLFCLGIQSSFVDIHLFANSQVKYSIWKFFSVTKYFSSLLKYVPSQSFTSVRKCTWIPVDRVFWNSNDRRDQQALLSRKLSILWNWTRLSISVLIVII